MNRLFTIAICLCLTLVLGISFLWPKYQEFKSLQKKVEAKRIELQFKEEYFLDLQKIVEELKKYEKRLFTIDTALPADPSLPALFDFFQKKASQSGLILKEITLGSITSSPNLADLSEIPFTLRVLGSYSSFKNFLAILEKSARLIEVENIAFSSPGKEGESFTFDLKIKVYSY